MLLKNSIINLLAGLSSIGAMFISNIYLSAYLSADEFNLWVLGLQFYLFAQMVSVSLISAVSRSVASSSCSVSRQIFLLDSYQKYQLRIFVGLFVFGLFFSLLSSYLVSWWDKACVAILFLGIGCVQGMVSVSAGYYVGIGKTYRWAVVQIIIRALWLLLVFVCGFFGFKVNVLAVSILLAMFFLLFSTIKVGMPIKVVDSSVVPEIRLFFVSLILNLSVYLTSAAISFSVAAFEYSKIGAFGLVLSGLAAMQGAIQAAMAPFFPWLTRMISGGRKPEAYSLLKRMSLGLFGISFGMVFIIYYSEFRVFEILMRDKCFFECDKYFYPLLFSFSLRLVLIPISYWFMANRMDNVSINVAILDSLLTSGAVSFAGWQLGGVYIAYAQLGATLLIFLSAIYVFRKNI